jgi:hypothetical protein
VHAAQDKLDDLAAIKPAIDRLPRQSNWNSIEIEKAERRGYSLTLWYREQAFISQAEAQADSQAIVRAVLTALVAQGRFPADQRVTVFVSAMRRFRGETGKAMVNWYGIASYDYNRDAVRYEECTGKSWFGC